MIQRTYDEGVVPGYKVSVIKLSELLPGGHEQQGY